MGRSRRKQEGQRFDFDRLIWGFKDKREVPVALVTGRGLMNLEDVPEGEECEPLTLGDVCVPALGARLSGDDRINPTEGRRIHSLVTKIATSDGPVRLHGSQVNTLQERLWKMYSAAIAGPATALLDDPSYDPLGEDDGTEQSPSPQELSDVLSLQ